MAKQQRMKVCIIVFTLLIEILFTIMMSINVYSAEYDNPSVSASSTNTISQINKQSNTYTSYFDAENLCENVASLILMTAFGSTIYIGVLYLLNYIVHNCSMHKENIKQHNNPQLLKKISGSIAQHLISIECEAHQMKNINQTLNQLDNSIIELIQRTANQTTMLPKAPLSKRYCENSIANATISYYVTLAENAGIDCYIHTQIPNKIMVDPLDLSMILSNLMENAVNACCSLALEKKSYLRMTVLCDKQLTIVIENPYENKIIFDKNGHPTSLDEGHGIGTKSILTFASRYGGKVIYRISDGIFNVRIIV